MQKIRNYEATEHCAPFRVLLLDLREVKSEVTVFVCCRKREMPKVKKNIFVTVLFVYLAALRGHDY